MLDYSLRASPTVQFGVFTDTTTATAIAVTANAITTPIVITTDANSTYDPKSIERNFSTLINYPSPPHFMSGWLKEIWKHGFIVWPHLHDTQPES